MMNNGDSVFSARFDGISLAPELVVSEPHPCCDNRSLWTEWFSIAAGFVYECLGCHATVTGEETRRVEETLR